MNAAKHSWNIQVVVVGFSANSAIAETKQDDCNGSIPPVPTQPAPWYEDAVAADLPVAPEIHRIPGAGHYDFLPPCGASLIQVASAICTSEAGFDRAGFHRKLNENIVAFLSRNLAVEAPEAVQAHGRPEGNVAIRPPVVNVKGPKR